MFSDSAERGMLLHICKMRGFCLDHRLALFGMQIKLVEKLAQRRSERRAGVNASGHFGQGIGAYHVWPFADGV
jgi:hypothetical protein